MGRKQVPVGELQFGMYVAELDAFPVGSVVELNSGETGIVIAENAEQRLKPTVVVVPSGRMLDLGEDPRTASGEPYRVRRTLEQRKLAFDPRQLL
jgi:hypothetical protein